MQVPQRSIDKQIHALGNVIFLEELPSIYAVGKEGIEAKDLCPSINIEYGWSWCA